MDVQVVLRPLQDPRWVAFVTSHPSALPFHHPSWAQMLAECGLDATGIERSVSARLEALGNR